MRQRASTSLREARGNQTLSTRMESRGCSQLVRRDLSAREEGATLHNGPCVLLLHAVGDANEASISTLQPQLWLKRA